MLSAILSQTETQTVLELAPRVPIAHWWQLMLLVGLSVLVIVFVVLMYVLDSVELPKSLRLTLSALRLFAFAAIILFILNPERRSETRIVKPSRVAVLVDTSLSMGLTDPEDRSTAAARRIDRVITGLRQTELIHALRAQHDVAVYRFGEDPQPEAIASFERYAPAEKPSEPAAGGTTNSESQSRNLGLAALGLAILSVCGLGAHVWVRQRHGAAASWMLAIGCLSFVAAYACVAVADLASSQSDLLASLGLRAPAEDPAPDPAAPPISLPSQIDLLDRPEQVDWAEQLNPRAGSTQLGQAIAWLVNKERGGSIAGVIVITDGRNNAGLPPSRAIGAAVAADIPVYPVGMGSDQAPRNVQLSDIQAPTRVFPGDHFQIKAVVQAFGMEGQDATLQLYSLDPQGQEAEQLEDSFRIKLLEDGQPLLSQFEVSSQLEGRRRYVVKIQPPPRDLDQSDNERATVVEVIQRKTQILLIAGGPSRDFRFLRNQLFRDKDVTLHVWLQTAQPGADQECDKLLFQFPSVKADLNQYDCIIAFDPDWRQLSESDAEALEQWVSQKAGGLIVTAGPVFAPEWTRRPRGDRVIDRIRQLYPVSFYSQGSATLKLGRFGGDRAFPLEFTREGRAAEYLWLGPTAGDSLANWQRFPGVFGYYAVNEAKPGADVLARFSDPDTAVDGQLPIYLAGHYYGAGRVFFQASSEVWRLRSVDVDFFDQYYTKLIRWNSQGRLLRDSSRGILLIDRNRCWVGDQVVVRAIMQDATDQPLLSEQVSALVLRPDGSTQQLLLRSGGDEVRPGTFSAQFSATLEGDYRITLPIPDSPDHEVLVGQVQASIPELEKQQPQRHDSLLKEIADKTGGHYFVGLGAQLVDRDDPLSLVSLVHTQDQITYLPGAPDYRFTRRTMMWLLGFVTCVLAMEWLLRRTHRLA